MSGSMIILKQMEKSVYLYKKMLVLNKIMIRMHNKKYISNHKNRCLALPAPIIKKRI